MALGDLLTDKQARMLTVGVGVSMIAFGALPTFAPRPFARLFGLAEPDPATASMMRSIGARDVVMGIGLWSAAAHGGKYLPWLLARALVDSGDTLSVGLAIAQGKRDWRWARWRWARRSVKRRSTLSPARDKPASNHDRNAQSHRSESHVRPYAALAHRPRVAGA